MISRPKPLAGAGEWSAGGGWWGCGRDGRGGTDGRTPHLGEGKAYLKGGSFQSPGSASGAQISPCSLRVPRPVRTAGCSTCLAGQCRGPGVRAVSRESLVPEPGYLWVSARRGRCGPRRAVSDLNSHTYRKLEPEFEGALVIPAPGWPRG